jgi:hypothetical protein
MTIDANLNPMLRREVRQNLGALLRAISKLRNAELQTQPVIHVGVFR